MFNAWIKSRVCFWPLFRWRACLTSMFGKTPLYTFSAEVRSKWMISLTLRAVLPVIWLRSFNFFSHQHRKMTSCRVFSRTFFFSGAPPVHVPLQVDGWVSASNRCQISYRQTRTNASVKPALCVHQQFADAYFNNLAWTPPPPPRPTALNSCAQRENWFKSITQLTGVLYWLQEGSPRLLNDYEYMWDTIIARA